MLRSKTKSRVLREMMETIAEWQTDGYGSLRGRAGQAILRVHVRPVFRLRASQARLEKIETQRRNELVKRPHLRKPRERTEPRTLKNPWSTQIGAGAVTFTPRYNSNERKLVYSHRTSWCWRRLRVRLAPRL